MFFYFLNLMKIPAANCGVSDTKRPKLGDRAKGDEFTGRD